MVVSNIPKIKKKKAQKKQSKIPKHLIYEEFGGRIYYYKGYKEVLKKQKKFEAIMGCSETQFAIISVILQFLYRNIPENEYFIATNEAGLHLEKKQNLAADIVIYGIDFLNEPTKNKYSEKPPKIVIEVDTKADLEDMNDPMTYFFSKTQQLFKFGVEKVIWFISTHQKVLVATPNADWIITTWDKNIEITEGISFALQQLLDARGVKIG